MNNSSWGDSWQHDKEGYRDSHQPSDHDHHRWPRPQLIALLVVGFATLGYMAALFAFLITRSDYLAAFANAFLTLNDIGLIICGIITCLIALQYDQVPTRKLPRWMIAALGTTALTVGIIGLASGLHWLGIL